MDGIDPFKQFVTLHSPQLLSSGVPQHFWQVLYKKIENDIFDAGSTFSLYSIDYDDDMDEQEYNPPWTVCVSKEDGISKNDPQQIYLIDHAWTFQMNQARQQLNAFPALTARMASIMGISKEDDDNDDEIVDKILYSMWKYCQFYSVQGTNEDNIESRMPIWYIMDEVGSAINHSDEPNFRLIPFLHVPTQITYSLLFPIVDCDEGDQVTRDYVENIPKESKQRAVALLPWKYTDFSNENFTQHEPPKEYFLANRVVETLPSLTAKEPIVELNRPLKVYSEYEILCRNLTASQFIIVDTEEEADILWYTQHFKDYENLSTNNPNKFVNQFPHENVITVKDLLSIVCRRASDIHHDADTLKTYPEWLPTTYNLKTEIVEFVSYFQNRTAKKLDNHWIVKPFNLARGLDIYITNNLTQIMRLPSTGPKIAQKYIENPVLYYREDIEAKVKFDMRYVIALKSVQPLEVYVYQKFFLRFSNKPFTLNEFDDYEKHFTVMNYTENAQLRRIEYDEFIKGWEKYYPENEWCKVENDIHEMFHQLFECATQKDPPIAIASSPQSRAIYAADIMLSWEDDNKRIQPKLLEINWMPDCKRACEYYPEFFNDIFKLLFLNEIGTDFRSLF